MFTTIALYLYMDRNLSHIFPWFQASSKIQARADAPNQAGKNQGVEVGTLGTCMNCWKLWICLACIRARATTTTTTTTTTAATTTGLLFLAEVPFVRDIFVFRIVGPTHLEQTEDVEDAVSGSARRRDQAPQDADAAMAWNQAERRLKFY